MKQIGMYSGVRSEEQIASDKSSGFFDTTDANLLFAYDLRDLKVKVGYLDDYSANANNVQNTNWSIANDTSGRAFTSSDALFVEKDLTEMPNTFEAVAYAPTNVGTPTNPTDGRVGVIFGNYHGGEACLNFEIHNDGIATVHLDPDSSTSAYSTKIADVRNDDGWVHIAVVRELMSSGGAKYTLYVDGKESATTTLTKDTADLDMELVQELYKFSLGGDSRSGNVQYFKGRIKKVALYKDSLSANQILSSYKNGGCESDGDYILKYDMTELESSKYVRDLSGNGYNVTQNGVPLEYFLQGRAFDAEDALYLQNKLTEMPMTYEAWILAPSNVSRTGVVFGNYGDSSISCLNFEIYSNRKPSIYIKDDEGNTMETKFDYSLPADDWAHVVITHELLATGGAKFTCYVNGEEVASFTTALSYKFTPEIVQEQFPLSLGHDSRSGNAQYFKGRIKNVALYSDVLTAEEIKASYENGIDTKNESIMLYYDLTEEANRSGTEVTDGTGNGYNLGTERYSPFFERETKIEDYDYAFAIVGDTQKLVYKDANNGTNYTSYIYDWIVANKDSKKIKLVMGVGDITEKNTAVEYEYVLPLIKKLGDAGILYSITPGNHDGPDSYTSYNYYFSSFTSLTDNITGYYGAAGENGREEDKTQVANYYIKTEIEGQKYIIFSLQYGAPDDILTWAGEICDANKDYKVIMTTHAYMFRDGTTLDSGDVVPPNSSSSTTDDNRNNGDMIWDKFVSQHENIVMTFSGHDPCPRIVMRQDIGVNENVVSEFLVDFQTMDLNLSYETGMVAMLYISKNGNVQVEYVSTYQTAMARKENPDAEDMLYGRRNCFTFDMNKYPEELITEYGVIPYEYRSVEKYPFVIFDENKNFKNAYHTLLDTTSSYDNNGAVHIAKNYLAGNVWDGTSFGDSPRAAYILMRADYTMADNETYNNLAQVQGTVTIDLGGFTLTGPTAKPIFNSTIKGWDSGNDNNNYLADTEFKIINGNINTRNYALIQYGTYTSDTVPDVSSKKFDYTFEDVNFKVIGTAGRVLLYHSGTKVANPYYKLHLRYHECKGRNNSL